MIARRILGCCFDLAVVMLIGLFIGSLLLIGGVI